MVDTDLRFAHSYEISEVREFPGSGESPVPRVYFPRLTSRPEHDGVFVEITPANGAAWEGVFKLGGMYDFARILSTPDLKRLCVVSGGAGYFVHSDDFERWEPLDFEPVRYAATSPEHGLLIFGCFTRLVAHDGNHIVWRSSRVCEDFLRVTSISDDFIEGVGYDPGIAGETSFKVDIRTGEVILPPSM